MRKLSPQTMLRLTSDMPMKQINLDNPVYQWDEVIRNNTPYLQRYYAGTFRDGCDLWLHRFLSSDGDRHVHNHPFEFQTVMLCGGYTEEFIDNNGNKDHRVSLPNANSHLPLLLEEFLIQLKSKHPQYSMTFLNLAHGANNSIDLYDWHRICAVNDDTWTAVIVNPKRLPKWHFKNDDGEIKDETASARDWWKNYKTRPDCDIALDDNRK